MKTALSDVEIAQIEFLTKNIIERAGRTFEFRDVMTALQLVHDGRFSQETVEFNTLIVNYEETFDQMVEAGQYDSVHVTNEDFPFGGKGIKKFEFFVDCPSPLGYGGSDTNLNREIKRIKDFDIENPWQPGKIQHLLALGKQFPDAQRVNSIIALGSTVIVLPDKPRENAKGSSYSPILSTNKGKRILYSDFTGRGFKSDVGFLVVRETVG